MKKCRLIRKIACILILILGLAAWFSYENNALTTTAYTIKSEKLPQALSGFKIVQISDLHNKTFGERQEMLIQRIQAERPDLIALTGDLVDAHRFDPEPALELARRMVEIAPVYFITGNHENRLDSEMRDELIRDLRAIGVQVLDNQAVSIQHNGARFDLIGLDDSHLTDRTLQALCLALDPNTFRVLLAHEPQYMDLYAGYADLALTGHAHGGQIRLPGLGGLFAPGQGFFPQYTSGVHTQGAFSMVVSRGLGNSLFPFRIFNRPEVVCITLESGK